MAQSKLLPSGLPAVQRYGLGIVSVAVALGAAVLVESLGVRSMEVPLLLFAVALTAWYGGGGSAAVALFFCCMGFDYFYVEPLRTFSITAAELPYFFSFTAFAVLVSW